MADEEQMMHELYGKNGGGGGTPGASAGLKWSPQLLKFQIRLNSLSFFMLKRIFK